MPPRSRTSKSILVLLAVIAVLLVRGTRRQRRLIRLLTGFGFAYPGQGAVEAVGGFFGGIGSDVRGYVESVIKLAADALQTGIDWAVHLANYASDFASNLFNLGVQLAWGFADAVRQLAGSLFWQAVGIAQNLWGSALQFAQSLFEQATRALATAFWQALDWANRLFSAAQQLIGAALQSALGFARSLFDFSVTVARNLVDAAISMLRGLINATASGLHDVFFAGLDFVRDQIGSRVSGVEDYLFGSVQSIIGVVSDVLDWLVAIAAFPFTTARDIWAAMRRTGGASVLEHAPDFVARWGDHVTGHSVTYAAAHDVPYELAPLPGQTGSGGGFGSGIISHGSGTPDVHAFAVALLGALSAPVTDSNLAFLFGWFNRENTRATFNPLATTLDYGNNTIFNSVGVRNYPDFQTGVQATARTIIGSGYPVILSSLRVGDGHAAGQAHADLRRWSGGGYDTIAA